MTPPPRHPAGAGGWILVQHQSALDGHVLIRPRIGESRNEAEPRLTDARPERIHKCQLPYGRVDRLVVYQLLHLVQDCLAPLGIQFGRLLLEQVVDLRIAAIGIGTALDDEGGETGRGVAEGAARALDDILEPLVAVRLEKSRSFARAQL